jgi:hypothetical protein
MNLCSPNENLATTGFVKVAPVRSLFRCAQSSECWSAPVGWVSQADPELAAAWNQRNEARSREAKRGINETKRSEERRHTHVARSAERGAPHVVCWCEDGVPDVACRIRLWRAGGRCVGCCPADLRDFAEHISDPANRARLRNIAGREVPAAGSKRGYPAAAICSTFREISWIFFGKDAC